LNLSLIDKPGSTTGEKIVDTTNLGSGMKLDFKNSSLKAYNFNLKGESVNIKDNTVGSYI
jgi:hypothetical protein